MIITEIQGNHHSLAAATARLDLYFKKTWEQYEKLDPKTDMTQSPEQMAETHDAGRQVIEASFIFCVVAASFIEAIANLYLALKCGADATLFATLERTNIEDKWEALPRLFNPSYKLNFGVLPGSDFVQLIRIRNKIVHSKAFIKENETVFQKGTKVDFTAQDMAFFQRLGSLPKLLVQNLERHDNSDAMDLLINMSGIETDWYETKRKERVKMA